MDSCLEALAAITAVEDKEKLIKSLSLSVKAFAESSEVNNFIAQLESIVATPQRSPMSRVRLGRCASTRRGM